MKKIIGYLRHHLKEDFYLPYYLIIFSFLAISIYLNYKFDFSDNYIDSPQGFKRILANFLFFTFSWLVPFLIWCIFFKKWHLFRNSGFILKLTFGLAILAADSGFPYLTQWLSSLQGGLYYWAYKVCINLISGLTVLLPIMVYHAFLEKEKSKVYGLGNTRFDWSPYVSMLLIMLPLIAGAAAFSEGFQRQYPMYPQTGAHLQLGVPEYVTVLGYELAYGLDFITVELLFRGLFVLGLISTLGRSSILMMACMYCFLHFGKPAGEAISSIFGGYILGVIAFETRSIWGGIVVHMGIAWLMEICAFLLK